METRKETVTDTYHGVEVSEDYRWLEDGTSDETKAWTEAQDAETRAWLAGVPARESIRKRFEEILKVESTAYHALTGAGSTYLALKSQPPKQQPFLVVLTDLGVSTGSTTGDGSTTEGSGHERVLVDPNELDAGGTTTIDFFRPSPDGSKVAVSLSKDGTEIGTVHVYDVATGEEVGEPLGWVNSGTAGGSVAWKADGTGLWATSHPGPGEVPDEDLGFFQVVAFHDLGTGETTTELSGVFAEDRIAENFLSTSPDGRWVLDCVQKGDGGEWQMFVREQDGGEWRPVADLADRWIRATFAGDHLFVLSVHDAPRGKVLRVSLPDGEAEVVVPESDVTIEGIAATDGRLWVVDLDGGPSGLRVFTHNGEPLEPVEVPEVSAVDDLRRVGPDTVAWSVESFTEPRSWWVASDGSAPRRTALGTRTPVDLSAYTVRRVFATSADGTQVPINLIARPDVEPGAPTLLYGYGGYAISMKPSFSPARLQWLEQGHVFAVANIRGGGEYGVAWHHGGRLRTKQNCFDDFIACADHLVETGVTTRDKLAIMGGSNGGLLMGAVLTQRPDVASAVVCAVPVLDAIRSETTANGRFNVTEFGTVTDPEDFAALLAYSPYHQVRDGVAYPPVLFTAGEFDPRVEAWHAKKMAARLQAATSSGQPVLLRMESGGHGIGQSLDQAVGLLTDYYTFISDRLDLDRG
ncbi:S9 family peptidase [Nocardioides sp. HDW12B]|uniref:prolyl oligopeptidase family serine peptidase n=1 Tax=Nocardioides sp. HDW12B TaxID=2714939 RepID=UPI0014099BDB|nr:prolyl oligopeptidase family serine peptidase [Nocardioides sp. HDW12B]QIK66261.1 S9 family peptidase [Nocardioides sp. HDW12B]